MILELCIGSLSGRLGYLSKYTKCGISDNVKLLHSGQLGKYYDVC